MTNVTIVSPRIPAVFPSDLPPGPNLIHSMTVRLFSKHSKLSMLTNLLTFFSLSILHLCKWPIVYASVGFKERNPPQSTSPSFHTHSISTHPHPCLSRGSSQSPSKAAKVRNPNCVCACMTPCKPVAWNCSALKQIGALQEVGMGAVSMKAW